MKKFAMLGKWHVHAEGYANQLNELPDCHVAKVWDPDADTARAWAKSLGCEADTLENILADTSIEGVAVCNATNEHADLLIRACDAGKAVFTEKVLTLTNEEAEAVKAAVTRNHTKFTISFPHLTLPNMQYAMKVIQIGVLGEISYARVRNVHNGATANWLPPHFYDPVACGGGAMIDLGAHPMYTLAKILGEPKAIRSTFTCFTGKAVEDNAVSVLEYENGAIGVSETGFLSTNDPYQLEVSGTKGTLFVKPNTVDYCCPATDNQWKHVDNFSEKQVLPIEQWALASSNEEIPWDFGIEAATRLTRLMVMAYQR